MKKVFVAILFGLLLLAGGTAIGRFVLPNREASKPEEKIEDKYVAFSLEIYDQVKENYWEKISDEELSKIYLLAVDKISGTSHSLKTNNREGVEKLLVDVLKDILPDKKKEFSATLGDMVLANLAPFGRSRLYAQKDEKALTNTVNNINPEQDHLSALGVKEGASDSEVKLAYETKLKEATTSAEKEKIAQSYEVIKDGDSRKIYEESGIEPTIEYRLISPSIFYMHWEKFSPTTMDEMAKVTAKVDKGNELDTLIIDLRGNIGGAIDGLPYFLGPFIGNDQYAYQFYHQGDKEDFKTRIGWMNSLVRYNKVIILIDNQSQSTAELMASVLKKYNVGVVMGETSKGWGTVERVFPIENQIADDEKFSLFLVHRVTLREDGQPIEGRGVEPNISIKDKNWKSQLMAKYNRNDIVKAIEEIYSE